MGVKLLSLFERNYDWQRLKTESDENNWISGKGSGTREDRIL
jgi:hypothetical protein